MSIETIKIKFLEEFMTLKDEEIIRKLYAALQKEKQTKSTSLSDFSGIWNEEEAAQMR